MQSIQQANLDVQYLESATVDSQCAHNLVEGVAKTPRLILSAGVVLLSGHAQAIPLFCLTTLLFWMLRLDDAAGKIKEIGSSSTTVNLAG
ncbi:hypothetical protein WN944_010288 [Citrus x changshan-huyou]|uniref:Uncharacterized protein n=1 Tax=Citrus x changshan-huyou TaxID=2935761 RepID=A0AAP0MRD2_9ROSI